MALLEYSPGEHVSAVECDPVQQSLSAPVAAQGERQGEKNGRAMWSSGNGNCPFPGFGGGWRRSGKGHQRVRSWAEVCGVGYVVFEFVEGAVE